MRVLSVLCFALGALLALGGLIHASKPSTSPIVTVVGAFVLPALFFWWGVIFHKRARRKD